MKKIYSIVLMATALLIGTNVKAANQTANDWASLVSAFAAVGDGETITLTEHINYTVTETNAYWAGLWVGTQAENGASKHFTLDLAGHNITISNNPSKTTQVLFPFVISKGGLEIVSATEAQITINVGNNSSAQGSNVFTVYGSYDYNQDPKATKPFSHLEIGQNVKVSTTNGTVIAIDRANPTKTSEAYGIKNNSGYHTDYFTDGYGFAFGARVDVKGKLYSQGGTKCYGIKTNGNLAYPGDEKKTVITSSTAYSWITDGYKTNVKSAEAISHAPYVHVHPGAIVQSDASISRSAAAYASGYAQWLIEGTCEGNIGVSASSGDIDINDATITSTATSHTAPTSAGGVTGSGSAIVVNSRDAYAGAIDVHVSGDTEVSATSGYAIEEAVNTKTDEVTGKKETKVENITISGGTFQAGTDPVSHEQQPAIVVAGETNQKADIVVYGGNVEGAFVVEGNETVNILDDKVASSAHTTEIVVNGNKVTVISEGAAPTVANSVIGAAAGTSIKWQNSTSTKEVLTTDLKLKELEISETYAQTLNIPAGKTLTAERVILGEKAVIEVEPGGAFIVTGKQGFVAPKSSNIILKASADKQATFLFHPDVESNRHPSATVQVYTNAKQLTASPYYTYIYQRFALPIMAGAAPTNDFSGELFSGATSYKTYAWQWNGTSWETISSWSSLEPFKGYQLANNSANGGVTYTFTGNLVGNGDATYNFPIGGFAFFGSSHMAPIYIDSLLTAFSGSDMEPTVWVYNFTDHQFKPITIDDLEDGLAFVNEIKALDGFILNLRATSGSTTMEYTKSVWGNPNLDAIIGRTRTNNAPARVRANSASNRASIRVMEENGLADEVKLIEKDKFSAEFDNGADASKFMYAEGINLYAITAAGELSNVATDDLTGTLLSFRSGNSTRYTLDINNVIGEDYALRDNVTGRVINITDNATYTFTQDANTTAQARFEVVKVVNVMTAIDNVEEAAKATGIYTMTGQYLGRDLTILPAGVYIVNGVKVVK